MKQNQKLKGFFPKLLCEASLGLFLHSISWQNAKLSFRDLSPLNYFKNKFLLSFPAKLALGAIFGLWLCAECEDKLWSEANAKLVSLEKRSYATDFLRSAFVQSAKLSFRV